MSIASFHNDHHVICLLYMSEVTIEMPQTSIYSQNYRLLTAYKVYLIWYLILASIIVYRWIVDAKLPFH